MAAKWHSIKFNIKIELDCFGQGLNIKKINFTLNTYAWAIWFVAALFYAVEFLQRVSPSVMAAPLMHFFAVGPAKFSFIISLYFYAYALAQIPVGLWLDRYGARRLLTLACLVISLASLLLAVSESLLVLAVSRILIGFASAFAFLGVLKLAAAWFPENRYALIVGLTNTIGVAGAILGEGPLAKLVQATSWQYSMIILAVVGFGVSILLWVVVKDSPAHLQPVRPTLTSESTWIHIKKVAANRQLWLTSFYAGLMVAPVIALGELWAVPFISSQYHLSPVAAAAINSAIFIGIGFGGPLNGWLASYVKRKKWIMGGGNFIALVCLSIVIYAPKLAPVPLFSLLFIFGFATSTMLLTFSFNKARFLVPYSAMTAALTNITIVLCGSIFQDLLGFLLSHFDLSNRFNYKAAFTIMPSISLLCLIILIFIREPKRQLTEV